ncbi:MAG: ankyrin repeat domain-containing protein [Hydrogenophaga sp.]|uniref:ankyrin repeat domain-containing protein n=1 Tax=Hydrogenophaga sp. TaxID=1904254 RepID=UPI003D0E8961
MKKRVVIKCFFLIGSLLTTSSWASSFDDFFAAIKRDDVAAIQALARRGFDLNTRNAAGEHPLYLALRDDAANVADYLVGQAKVDVNAVSEKGETPLMMAALKGHLAMARRLIDRKAEVNKTGWTPLHYAATHAGAESPAIVRLLLENHAYIDAESPNRTTPLMMAAHYGNPGVVKLLLEEGADPLLKNQKGLSAIDFAQGANRAESAEIIAAFVRAKQPRGRW